MKLDPQTWDRLYYREPEQLRRIADSPDPALVVRAAHAYLHLTRDAAGMLQRLEQVDQAPAQGLKLLALCELGAFGRVTRRGYRPRGHSALELEEAMYAEWALSIAHASLGNGGEAERHIDYACYLAALLGVTGRLTMLETERQRQRIFAGRPDAAALLAASQQTLRAGRPGRFALETYIEALLAEGRYQKAAGVAARHRARLTPGLDDAIAAMARLPLAVLDPATPHGTFALMLQALLSGADWQTSPTYSEAPWPEYAAIVRACQLALREHPELALISLPSPLVPDQRAVVAALRWVIWLKSGVVQTNVRPLSLPAELYAATAALKVREAVTGWLSILFPNEMLLLKLLELAHPALRLALTRVPILAHRAVYLGAQKVNVPARVSAALLNDALSGTTLAEAALEGYERSRFITPLRELGVAGENVRRCRDVRLVNPVTLYRYAERVSLQAQHGREADRLAARLALEQAQALIPAGVAETFVKQA